MEGKTKTILIVSGCVLAVALVVFLLWRLKKKDPESGVSGGAVFLQQGDTGSKVETLQKNLNKMLADMQEDGIKVQQITVDGIFGAETATACKMVLGHEYVTEAEFSELD